MISAADDDIGETEAGAIGRMGWRHMALHSDWGDTKTPERDGGFETAAVVYTNLENMDGLDPVPFADVEDKLADDVARAWFMLEDGDGDADTPMAVDIEGDEAMEVANIRITVEGATFAELTRLIETGATAKGTYFGAHGTFECIATDTCTITRETTGTTPFEADAGTVTGDLWRFTPDATATVALPDQDWLAFGFWLTAPDDMMNGTHRLGVFYDGLDTYGYDTARTDDALDGTATYAGIATGYYVDGEDESGLFTADASLMAVFDNGLEAPDNVENMLSGRIDNFRDSEGAYIDSDNRGAVNQGGENDWFVRLNAGPITSAQDDNGMATGTIGGSGDGILWTSGEWAAQLYGGGDRLTPVAAPSGVAGQFRAISDELATGGYQGVIGTFGASLGVHTALPEEE
jgi:hypothetical protein